MIKTLCTSGKLKFSLSVSAALVEPISCVSHGWDYLRPIPIGMNILLTGAGIIGALWACVLHVQGHRKVTVSEPNTTRLSSLKNLSKL